MLRNLQVVTNYLKSDLIKKQRSFKIGLLTIFLVVLFVSLLMNFIFISPIIFLKLSENEIGEADIMITPLLSSKDVKYQKGILESLISLTPIEVGNSTKTNILSNNVSNADEDSIEAFLDRLGLDGVSVNIIKNNTGIVNNTNDSGISYFNGQKNITSIPYINNYRNKIFNSNKDSVSNINFQLMNFTQTKELIMDTKNNDKEEQALTSNLNYNGEYNIIGAVPRWIFKANTSIANSWAAANVLIINSEIENKYRYGRKMSLNNLGFLECYISKSLFNALELNKTSYDNNEVEFEINPTTFINTLGSVSTTDYDQVHYYSSVVEDDDSNFNPKVPFSLYETGRKGYYSNSFTVVEKPTYINKTRIEGNEEGKMNNNTDSNMIKEEKIKETAKYLRDLLSSISYLNQEYNVRIQADKVFNSLSDEYLSSAFSNSLDLSLFNTLLESGLFNSTIDRIVEDGIKENLNENDTIKFNFLNFSVEVDPTDIIDLNTTTTEQQNQLRDILFQLAENITTNNSLNINSGAINIDNDNNKDTDDNEINLNSTITLQQDEIEKLLKNTIISFQVSPKTLFDSISDEDLVSILSFKLKLKVVDVVEESGKWPSALGNVIVIDSQYGKHYVIENIIRIIEDIASLQVNLLLSEDTMSSIKDNLYNEILSDFNLDHYALSISYILNNKFDLYKKKQYNQLRDIVKVSDHILTRLGDDYPTEMTLTIYETYQVFAIVKIFLDNIFSSVMFFLIILSIMLIYSLMNGNVEERTFEFGMLRAVGYVKKNLKILILLQAIIFSIPAIALGLTVSGIFNIMISYLLFKFSGLASSYGLNVITVIVVSYIILYLLCLYCYIMMISQYLLELSFLLLVVIILLNLLYLRILKTP